MAAKRTSDDDGEREQRKRPAEDEASDPKAAKVPKLLGKDEKGDQSSGTIQVHQKDKPIDDTDSSDKRPVGTEASGEEKEPKKRRVAGEDEEDKDDANAREADRDNDDTDKDNDKKDTDKDHDKEDTDKDNDKKDSDKDHDKEDTDKDNDKKDTDNDKKETDKKDADSGDKGADTEDKTDGEKEPKKQKVADEDEDKTAQDAGTNDEKAADTEGDAKEDDEKEEGGEEEEEKEKKEQGGEEKKDGDGNDDDDGDEENNGLKFVFILEQDADGEWRIKDVLITREQAQAGQEEEEGSEKSEDTEGESTGEDDDELMNVLAALFGNADTEEEQEQEEESQVDSRTSEEDGRDLGEEDEDGGGATKTAGEETGEEEQRDEAAAATTKSEREEEDVEMKEEEDEEEDDGMEDPVTLHVTYNKQCYDIELPLSARMSRLKKAIAKETGIKPSMQKLCYKGATQPDDSKSLRDCGLSANAKILMVGSTAQDVDAVKEPPKPTKSPLKAPLIKREPFCKQERHKAIIDDGVPDDAFPGISNAHDDLPNEPITGMLNSKKQKVRLSFKLEEDEFWISTKEATQRIPIGKVMAVASQPIEGHEEYHIMCIMPGLLQEPVWLYWVPAQYVRAIKKAMLGR